MFRNDKPRGEDIASSWISSKRTSTSSSQPATIGVEHVRGCSALSWLEGPAAFQATCLVARRDEPAKRAHSLRREVPVVCFHPQKSPQRSGQEGVQTTQAGKKRMWREGHG
jgi:hypothetical protein